MALEQVSTYVSTAMKQKLELLACHQQMTVSRFIKMVMGRVVEQNPVSAQPPESAAANADLHLRLNVQENDALVAAACRHGMNRQQYLLALVRANTRDLPTATADELAALRECNQQLLRIGRNLNQIARVLNVDSRQVPDFVPQSLARLLDEVKSTHRITTALVQQTLGRWTCRELEVGHES